MSSEPFLPFFVDTSDTPSPPLETLSALAEASRAKRLSPADEERATLLLKELLNAKRSGIAAALEPLLALPWIVSVNAIIGVWPDLSIPMRRLVLSGLAKHESEAARRLRLSLARALFKIEPAAGLKLAATVVAQLRDPESGLYPPRHRQIFFNVLIGKGKPWLLQFSLDELKPSEALALVRGAVEVFGLCAPLSQLSLMRWIAAGGRLKKLSEEEIALLAKGIARWNGRLQRQLRTDVEELPEAITAVFKPERKEAPPAPAPEKPEKEVPSEEEAAAPETPVAEEEAPESPVEESDDAAPVAEEAPEEGVAVEAVEEKTPEERPARPPRPTREERDRARREEREKDRAARAQKQAAFDPRESLRGIEQYINSLRNELEQTKAQLRRREEEGRRGSSRRSGPEELRPGVDAESLLRHNVQLESTIADLRTQLEDLRAHHESVAESRKLHTDEPLPEGSAEQLKALLRIKLAETFETYGAMRLDPLDRVFRLDYRDLLGYTFEILAEQGITFDPPKA